jgi:hypothetical protein
MQFHFVADFYRSAVPPGCAMRGANHKRCDVMIMVRSWAVVGILKINIGKLPGPMDFYSPLWYAVFSHERVQNQA